MELTISPLEYERRVEHRASTLPWVVGAAVGIGVTLPAIFWAIASGGAGHGHYVAARALFPLPMLCTWFGDHVISLPIIVFALLQFPAYGAIVGWAAARGWRMFLAIFVCVFVVHAAAVVMCFSGAIPNFS